MESMLGQGIYSVSEASRLTKVSPRRIRRWFRGYSYGMNQKVRRMPPVVPAGAVMVDGQLQLSFLDLMEVRLIDKFLEFGVGWKELRRAARVGADMLSASHPFATFRFRTDGQQVFAEVGDETGDQRLVELSARQTVFRQIIEPTLKGVDFDEEKAVRWWPLGERRRVVIDPTRAFGRPIASGSGVPAMVLGQYALEHGPNAAADWFEVDAGEVRDCIAFSKRFAA